MAHIKRDARSTEINVTDPLPFYFRRSVTRRDTALHRHACNAGCKALRDVTAAYRLSRCNAPQGGHGAAR